MGCSIDRFNVFFKDENMATKFTNMFSLEFKDKIGNIWGLAPSKLQETGEFCISATGEPMYLEPDYCENIIIVVEKFLKENQDAYLYGNAEQMWSNCGDTTIKEFSYNPDTHILHVETRGAEIPYICECDECGYECEDDEYIARMETHEEGQTYVCPECGEEIEFEVYISEENINILD